MAELMDIFGNDGTRLHGKFWHHEKAKAIICIVHGFGEHIDRYDELAEFLNENGIAVAGMDLRGHGRSEGLKGHTPGFDHYLNDVEELLKSARADYTDIPMFLFGQSMGGLIVLGYVTSRNTTELSGFIASNPWLGLAFEPPAWKVKAGQFIANILPKFRMDNELNPETLSRIPEVVETYKNDPLVTTKISVRTFVEVSNAIAQLPMNMSKLKVQGLVYHGAADQLIDHDATEQLVSNSSKIDWESIPEAYHEPHNDLCKAEIFEKIKDWVNRRLS
ncbi:MAG: lysophospholipase [Cyclobacteriaceae bacterium]